MGDLLPQEVVSQKKRTFTFPWEYWLRGPLKKEMERSSVTFRLHSANALTLARLLKCGRAFSGEYKLVARLESVCLESMDSTSP